MAVLYSQGYRIDFDSKRITQIGGLFLKVGPKRAEVYLDGKLKNKTDFFFGSLLIEDLLPKKYKIEIKKPGFSSWEKTLEIKEKEVTEAKNIILFPENLNFSEISKRVEKFWFSPDQKKIVLKESNPPADGGWALKLYDLDKNVKSHLINEKNIYLKGADLLNLEFSENSKEIYLEVGAAEQIKNFSLSADKAPSLLTEIKKTATSAENIIISKKTTKNNDAYFLNKDGHLFKNEEQLTEKPFPVREETEYALETFPNFIFLREGEVLYELNPNLKSFEKFFDGIRGLKISPDSKKLVYFSDYEIWILFLKEKFNQPQKKAGEKVFLMRLSEKIQDIFWLNSDYLVFNTGSKIGSVRSESPETTLLPATGTFNGVKISEIDDRDKINVININPPANNGGGVEIFWNQIDKKIYILIGEILYSSNVLFP